MENQRKNKILESAIQLFKDYGFYNVSIEDIVTATDSSTGSFYNYFGSKDELVISYRRQLLNTCNDYFNQIQEDEAFAKKNSLCKLKAFTHKIIDLLTEVGEEFGRVFITHRLKETDAVSEDKPYYPLILNLVQTGQEDKSIRSDYSSEEIADIIDFFIMGCYIDWLMKRGTYNINDSRSAAVNMLFHNISSLAEKNKPKQMYFSEIWTDVMNRTTKDFRSDIKNLENQWLERLYGNKSY